MSHKNEEMEAYYVKLYRIKMHIERELEMIENLIPINDDLIINYFANNCNELIKQLQELGNKRKEEVK
jgi:hypothetical protein